DSATAAAASAAAAFAGLVRAVARGRPVHRRRRERQAKARGQIERLRLCRAAALAREGPRGQPIPMVRARVVDEYWRRVRFRRANLQILIEERLQHVATKFMRRVAGPLEGAE